ncbi:MAG TPA: hypothetical protein VHV83_12715 [Armatimonadota bacterium]|nr:hypothetical protein [Armatimonadota bacterium]
MSLTDLRAEVSDALRQPIDDASRLTTAMVDRAINRAYIDFAKASACFSRTVALTTVANQATLTLPSDLVHVRDVQYNGTPLTPATSALLDLAQPGWRTLAAGVPDYWLCDMATTLVLSPAPSTDGQTVLVTGQVTPSNETGGIPLLTAATDAPQLPFMYHRALAFGAIVNLGAFYFADDATVQPAMQAAAQQFAALMKSFRADLVTEGAYGG